MAPGNARPPSPQTSDDTIIAELYQSIPSNGRTESSPPHLSPRSLSTSSITSSFRRARSRNNTIVRSIAFISSVATALCAGSITVFSLYGHIFQERLHYTQFQVNGVAIGSSIALYLPVSLLGYICDRFGTAPLSALAAVLFGLGYGLAALVYRTLDLENGSSSGYEGTRDGGAGWAYPLMVFAFVCIGVATCAMYLSAVATCAKNFGKGKHRGLALAMPIAGFGLSGMWLSQVGIRFFVETLPGGEVGDLDVFRFFVFLGALLLLVGVVGIFTLRVVDEQDLIDEAVEELERSGLLRGNSFISDHAERSYGTVRPALPGRHSLEEDEDLANSLLDPTKDGEEDDDNAKWKKNWVLNAETRRFLNDKTMWLFAVGFLLMIGPGEAFINNLGTVIGSLYPSASGPSLFALTGATSPATHVSLVGITSTVARLLTGSLTDLLAPPPPTQHVQVGTSAASAASGPRRISVSRITFLLTFGLMLSFGLLFLASGLVQNHGERFWVVSSLVGAGYGAVFSLTPIIITVIWGVENFATNWGIVATFPALGSTCWGLVYSAVYQAGAAAGASGDEGESIFCHGTQCYAPTFWAMTITVWIACGLVAVAWKGRGGWSQRGIVI